MYDNAHMREAIGPSPTSIDITSSEFYSSLDGLDEEAARVRQEELETSDEVIAELEKIGIVAGIRTWWQQRFPLDMTTARIGLLRTTTDRPGHGGNGVMLIAWAN